MNKHDIIHILNEIGVLLEIKGESFFKSKAYYEAARAIEFMDEDIELLVKEDKLKELKGFGTALSQKIGELVTTGKLIYYDNLKESIPQGLIDMLKIPGLGPKKVRAVYEKLGITTIGELKYACIENRLTKLTGFGEKTQQKILEGIENLNKYAGKFLYPHGYRLANELLKSLRENSAVIRCSECGSLRRKKEVIKDIDILVSCNDSSQVMDIFTKHPLVETITSKGDTKSSVILHEGISVDLRVVTDNEYPYALHHFTGSKEHNTALRHLAKQMGIKMNEYGLFKDDLIIDCSTEEDIFKVFGLQYIPPELRENNGEFAAASTGTLPDLITINDIKGVFHVHTNYSDGSNNIEDLATYCIGKGYSYIGISDHSQTAYYAGGLKVDDIKRQHEEIDKLNQKHRDFKILKGIELDILPDGSVDYDDEVLSWFDFTIASVHSSFNMDEKDMTDRVIKAMKNKHVTILGHPTGRLLLSREPFKIDIKEIIRTAAEEKIVLEINANPHRLDMDWRYLKSALEEGCTFVISPDAHCLEGINDIEYGVNIARKGWLSASNVINTMDWESLRFGK
ncbi:DNA polymerase/3'-5' exonuclease PolX [Pseudobacteroides cellulosolvens]|uniref:DNA polymerase beta n=1 Tax=Pseudobacteroides cellulosolvens ATCC 35603 = DSM 2933 TaxID=398512 RepID=A0A0L6JWX7_9FIRM|nr:DNA polymerase/3'-5' exonuclease PolX [Pseudobacteroides cellulosolvens]KNY30353.1 PHP domain protein [Pseudobacteroides cellulosolvens ATCC 35603 = DSM 2933]